MAKLGMSLSGKKHSWNKRGPRRHLTFDSATEALVISVTENQYQWLKARWPYPVEEDEGEA